MQRMRINDPLDRLLRPLDNGWSGTLSWATEAAESGRTACSQTGAVKPRRGHVTPDAIVERGLVDEDEEVQETADRPYWEKRASKKTLAIVDEIFNLVRGTDPTTELKYSKGRISLARDGSVDTTIVFHPKRSSAMLGFAWHEFQNRMKSWMPLGWT